MSYKIYNQDNMSFEFENSCPGIKADVIFCDYIYENLDFSWAKKYWEYLRDGGILVAMTDYHSAAEYKIYADTLPNSNFVNWIVWKNEFGNFAKNKFRQCHDDIIIFSKGKNYKFYFEKAQIEKATANSKGLNPSGRKTKLATSVITDICLTTVAKERVKNRNGKNIRWQKPLNLYSRILKPFLDTGDWIIDPFMGSGSLGKWCNGNNINYIGIEYDLNVYEIAKRNIEG